MTLLVDVIGAKIMGGGRLAFRTDALPPAGATASSSLVALPEGIGKLDLAPGLKVNLKGKLVLSLNALVALSDRGLHARFTPVAGINMVF